MGQTEIRREESVGFVVAVKRQSQNIETLKLIAEVGVSVPALIGSP
jgi:hypothetical protein